MASNSSFQWVWSEQHQDYYFVTRDLYGNNVYNFAKQQPTPDLRPRSDSGAATVTMPDPVQPEIRTQLYDFIPGTPEAGWYEPLDSSYQIRTKGDAYSFFRLGKVFAMLHIQSASEQALYQTNDNITVVKYGEHAFSQIRRFIIVEVRRGFVYACPITTYSGRGTLKHGCVPSEHSMVYFRGSLPSLLPGETLVKEPIGIDPAVQGLRMDAASRLHYSKAYPIEMNVKVKDIGDVIPEDLSNLLRHYKQENNLRD